MKLKLPVRQRWSLLHTMDYRSGWTSRYSQDLLITPKQKKIIQRDPKSLRDRCSDWEAID
jgi:hypothetical protein